MGRKRVRREFRVHHRMTQLSAKLHGVRKLVRLVAANDTHQDKDDGEAEEECDGAALSRIVEVHSQIAMWLPRLALTASITVPPCAPCNQQQAENEKSRGDHVRENAHIRTRLL